MCLLMKASLLHVLDLERSNLVHLFCVPRRPCYTSIRSASGNRAAVQPAQKALGCVCEQFDYHIARPTPRRKAGPDATAGDRASIILHTLPENIMYSWRIARENAFGEQALTLLVWRLHMVFPGVLAQPLPQMPAVSNIGHRSPSCSERAALGLQQRCCARSLHTPWNCI